MTISTRRFKKNYKFERKNKKKKKRNLQLLTKLFVFINESEFRREFKTISKKSAYDYLEIRSNQLRFVYDLKLDSFSWQIKINLKKHGVVCPYIETCHHSLESPLYSSVFQIPTKVKSSFFFLNGPTFKTYLFDNGSGVVAYERTSENDQKWFLECENYKESDVYFNLAIKLKAERGRGKETSFRVPPVIPINWETINSKRKKIWYVAVKWEGSRKKMMALKSFKNERLDFALAGNQYCVETFKNRHGVIVDVCNFGLSILERTKHLIFLRETFALSLRRYFSLIVQYFHYLPEHYIDAEIITPNFLKKKTTADNALDNLPCDGLIFISNKSIFKLKPALKNTIDLLSMDSKFLRDREGFSYTFNRFLYNKKGRRKSLKINRIYEAYLYDNDNNIIIVKKRKDKIYPNSRKIIIDSTTICCNNNNG